MSLKKFTILITTKNRKEQLFFTLEKIKFLLDRDDVACIICDDGSDDGTFEAVQNKHPEISLLQNKKSKGLIYSRNRLMNLVKTEFSISIDDDLHFITPDPLEKIADFFEKEPKAGLLGFRIYWDALEPEITETKEKAHRVKSFAGGAHVWRMKAWKEVPDYPYWFVFYGEEDFQSYQLFKKDWYIFYLPEVLVNHRVNLKERKVLKDYDLRQRRSLRSGWYLFFLFYPLHLIPRKFFYTLWIQFKTKVFLGKSIKALFPIVLAFLDLIVAIPKIIKYSNRLSSKEFKAYSKLEETKIYWNNE